MLSLPQEILNDIAMKEEMKYLSTKLMFLQPEDNAERSEEMAEAAFQKKIKKDFPTFKKEVTMSLWMWEILPLLLENKAITKYIAETNQPELRMALPEILTPEEALILLRKEKNYSLTPTQEKIFLYEITFMEKNLPLLASQE